MNKIEFLNRLEELLADISPAEKDEAMQYYREYFEDAGVENEASVIRELGSPAEVARTIKEGLAGRELSVLPSSANSEWSTDDKKTTESDNQTASNSYASEQKTEKKKMDPVVFVLVLIAACFLGLTVGLPVVSTLCGLIIGIAATIFGLLCGVLCAGIGLVIAGFALVVAAIVTVAASPAVALLLLGLALVLGSIGVMLIVAGIQICVHGFPLLKAGIMKLYDWMMKTFGKKEA